MGFFEKLKNSLTKTRDTISEQVNNVFSTFVSVDEDFFEELEDALILSDMGVDTTEHIIKELRNVTKSKRLNDKNDIKLSVKVVYDKEVVKEKYPDASEEDLKKIIWEQIKEINKTFPPYKYIKNMILTDEELIKTTTKKVKRNEEIKKILENNN